jgi:hypothetical protein
VTVTVTVTFEAASDVQPVANEARRCQDAGMRHRRQVLPQPSFFVEHVERIKEYNAVVVPLAISRLLILVTAAESI